jgi:hypothetical protein
MRIASYDSEVSVGNISAVQVGRRRWDAASKSRKSSTTAAITGGCRSLPLISLLLELLGNRNDYSKTNRRLMATV